ncbi:MAG: ribosome biogenesis GTPase Der, partial [bacterium]
MSEEKIVNEVIVPIIGRPNVGKSTLFNALIGKKRAVTGSRPGVTRDRVVSTLNLGGKSLTLVDTAGFQQQDNPSAEYIVNQVESMIREGQLLLFVVDGATGLTPLDYEIAEKLRPCSERVLVVVNKADPGNELQETLNDFYELGFPHMVAVSARHRRNLDELRAQLAENIPRQQIVLPEDGIRLALLGRPNVGKSTLFNSIIGYERVMVSEEAGTTRDVIDISFEVDEQRFHLVDTVGLRRKSKVSEEVEEAGVYQTLRALNFCDVACLILDWNQRVTKQDQRLAGLIADRYRGCMILVNKADYPDERGERSWRRHLDERFSFLKYAPLLFTSGLEGRGLADIFSRASTIYEEMNRRIPEEKLFNAFLDIKGQISWSTGQARSVILRQIRQIDVNPITFEIEATRPQ